MRDRVSCTHLDASPLFLPIPSLDGHVITTGKHDTRGRVDGQTANVIWMGFECSDFLVCIIIEDSKLEII